MTTSCWMTSISCSGNILTCRQLALNTYEDVQNLEYLPHLCESPLLHQSLLHAVLQPPCMRCNYMKYNHELCLDNLEGFRHAIHQ